MVEENRSQKFILRKTDETRNFFIEEIKQINLMSKKHKKVCAALNSINNYLYYAGCLSISAFASLVGIPIAIASFAVGLKICAITAEIKKV